MLGIYSSIQKYCYRSGLMHTSDEHYVMKINIFRFVKIYFFGQIIRVEFNTTQDKHM